MVGKSPSTSLVCSKVHARKWGGSSGVDIIKRLQVGLKVLNFFSKDDSFGR